MTEAEGLHTPTLVANCVLNGFLSYTAIVLNIITIHALRKTSSLPTTLKTLLLSLSISDLGVGLLVQPLYVAFLTMEITTNTKITDNIFAYRAVVKAYAIPNRLFVVSSFFGVFAITVDRFLAIHLHLRYQELVTHKRVVAVVISFWVFSVIACFRYESIHVLSVMSVVCIITTGLLYCKIYAAARHHTNQIRLLQIPEQVAQNGDMANAARLRKTAVATFYVYILFLVCYLPIACAGLATMIHGKNAFLSHLWFFSWTVVYLNSSFNPLIYSWKMRHIRQAVLDTLRNICPSGQRE